MLLIGIPLAALAATFFVHDEAGSDRAPAPSPLNLHFDADTILRMNGSPRHDLMLAMGRTLAATYTLKYSVDEERPNGADSHSFPSGHAAVTFAGAEFIRKEYGWWWGVPAYTLASFVGYSRVKAKDHYTADVLTGATIGVLSNHDLHEFFTPFGRLSAGAMLTEPHDIAGVAGTPWREENATQFAPSPTLGFTLRF